MPDSEERKKYYPHRLFLTIDTAAGDAQELSKIVKSLIINKKKQHTTKSEAFQHARNNYPSTTVRHDALERYLKVYNLRKNGATWREISKALPPKSPKAIWENAKRSLQDDYNKAKKIIKFTEYGYFPGPYDDTTRQRGMRAKRR